MSSRRKLLWGQYAAGRGGAVWKRVSYEWRRLLRLRATPHEIAIGCAVGIFAACTPFIGLQMALAGVLALLLRGSIPAALAGTFVGNPLSWPAIWSASYVVGAWVLGQDPALAVNEVAISADLIGSTIASPTPEAIDAAAVKLSGTLQPLTVGGALVGLIAAAASYYPTRRAVRLFQGRKRLTV